MIGLFWESFSLEMFDSHPGEDSLPAAPSEGEVLPSPLLVMMFLLW